MIKTHPLSSIGLDEAKRFQFRLVDSVTRAFPGSEVLSMGDSGLRRDLHKPLATSRVESVIADFFGVERAVLVQGAGTGALRSAFMSAFPARSRVLVHDAPVYPTTATTLESMATELVRADYNDLGALEAALKREKPAAAIVQLARQKIDDSYSHEAVIALIKRVSPETVVITDDNYAVMKVERIGAQCGADLSAFSLFKLLGPEGVGCVVGKRRYVEVIEKQNYSGGTQVQGHQAMAALRGLIQAPVALAIQSGVVEELAERLSKGEVGGVKGALAREASGSRRRVGVVPPEATNIDYHFELGELLPAGTPLVMAFRTQVFVTRSRVVPVEGISTGKPRIAGIFDSQGGLVAEGEAI